MYGNYKCVWKLKKILFISYWRMVKWEMPVVGNLKYEIILLAITFSRSATIEK